jgi:hypothetical protein
MKRKSARARGRRAGGSASYLAVIGFCITIKYMGVKTSCDRRNASVVSCRKCARNGRRTHLLSPADERSRRLREHAVDLGGAAGDQAHSLRCGKRHVAHPVQQPAALERRVPAPSVTLMHCVKGGLCIGTNHLTSQVG